MGVLLVIIGLLAICFGFFCHFYTQFGDVKSIQDIRFRDVFFEMRISWATLWIWIIFFCGMLITLKGIVILYG
jgi:hypothetical protein